MDYASFKLNLTAIGLDTKALDDAVIVSDGERQVAKVFFRQNTQVHCRHNTTLH